VVDEEAVMLTGIVVRGGVGLSVRYLSGKMFSGLSSQDVTAFPAQVDFLALPAELSRLAQVCLSPGYLPSRPRMHDACQLDTIRFASQGPDGICRARS
jgi:hypothetical protein